MRLRVVTFPSASPWRSQAVYHGVAEAMGDDDDPVLILVTPNAPYLSIGLHQDAEAELDLAWCARQGLPVIRRHVGGGTVWLDGRQLFYHFVFPRRLARGPVQALYPRFIEPVLQTYRRFGLPAELRPPNDIHLHGRKIGGTGAATIGRAYVLVGSFLYDFDTTRFAQALRLPSQGFRRLFTAALRRYMTTLRAELTTPPSPDVLRATFVQQVSAALDMRPTMDRLRSDEEAAVDEWARELVDPDWTHQRGRRLVPHGVKLAAGVYLTEIRHPTSAGTLHVRLLARDGRCERLHVRLPERPETRTAWRVLARRLRGLPLEKERVCRTVSGGGLQIPLLRPMELCEALLAAVHREP